MTNPYKINEWIRAAFAQGINLVDIADIYPCKTWPVSTFGTATRLLGEALKLTTGLREKLILIAKMGMVVDFTGLEIYQDASPEHVQAQVDFYLQTLQTSYLDIVMLHFTDSFMDPDALARKFKQLRDNGIVHHFGVSNHYPLQFEALDQAMKKAGLPGLVTNEVELSAWNPRYLNYDSPVIAHSQTHGYRAVTYGTLGGDPLGGWNRLFHYTGTRQAVIRAALRLVAGQLGVDEQVVAVAWVLAHPAAVIPLLGSTSIERIRNQVSALEVAPRMTHKQWHRIAVAGGVCFAGDIECNYKKYEQGPFDLADIFGPSKDDVPS